MDLGKADKTLRNLKPKAASYQVALGDGISCRVAPNGLKTMELRARLHDTVQRLPLGHYPAVTVAEAVAKAAEFRAQLKQGISPKVALQRAATADVPRTVAEAAARFIEGHLAVKAGERWATEAKRIVDVDVLPAIGHYPLAQLQRSDVTALIENKARALRAKGGKAVAANRLAAVLAKCLGWCGQQGWVSFDLSTKLPKPAAEKAKDRVLLSTDAQNELGAVWNAITESATGDGPLLQVHTRVLQLLALTGARCSEITGLTTADIDLKAGTITITDGKTDASNRTLPLTPVARTIIEAQIAEVGQGLLFPSPRAGTEIPSNEISRTCRDLVKLLKLQPFTPHDLRRTAASIMAEAGVDGDIRRRVTGHQAEDIHGRVYDRAQRLDDMRKALQTIEGAYTAAATRAATSEAGTNVVSIAAGKGRGK